MSFSLVAQVYSGQSETAHLFLNGERLTRTEHTTYSAGGEVKSTGGRVETLEAHAGDTVEIRAAAIDNFNYQISFCGEYIPKV